MAGAVVRRAGRPGASHHLPNSVLWKHLCAHLSAFTPLSARLCSQLIHQRDSSRAAAPLAKADDAHEIVSDGMAIGEVVARITGLVQNAV